MVEAPRSAMPESIDDRYYVIATRQALDAAVDGESLGTAGPAHAKLGAALALWPEMRVLSEPTTA
jgi:hypothetical protein